jgi:hypothetical protein
LCPHDLRDEQKRKSNQKQYLQDPSLHTLTSFSMCRLCGPRSVLKTGLCPTLQLPPSHYYRECRCTAMNNLPRERLYRVAESCQQPIGAGVPRDMGRDASVPPGVHSIHRTLSAFLLGGWWEGSPPSAGSRQSDS